MILAETGVSIAEDVFSNFWLVLLLKTIAVLQPQPEVHLRADHTAAYGTVAQTLADASKAGLSKIGFVSEPEQR